MSRKNTETSLWVVWFLILLLSCLWTSGIVFARRALKKRGDSAPAAPAPAEGGGEGGEAEAPSGG